MPARRVKKQQRKKMHEKRWLEITADVPFEYVEPVASLFSRYGQGGAVIEHAGDHNPDEGEIAGLPDRARVRTYVPLIDESKQDRELVHIGLSLIAKVSSDVTHHQKEIGENEWVESWKSHFPTLRVGKNLIIKPPWDQKTVSSNEIEIKIDPGLAFGTGHHPTTKMTLQCIERLISKGMRVLDVGSGSGILSIAASKLGAKEVFGIEVDSDAVRSSESNICLNNSKGIIKVLHGPLPHPEIQSYVFDLIVANISSKALTDLSSQLRSLAHSGGLLIASGVLAEQSMGVKEAFIKDHFEIIEEHQEGDWVALVCLAIDF